MKQILLTSAWEIFTLGSVQGVDIGVARDMFCENLATYQPGQPVHYDGADVDYDALAPLWQGMDTAAQGEAKTLYTRATREKYQELTAACRAKDRAAFYLALLSYEAPQDEKKQPFLLSYAWDCWDCAEKMGVDLMAGKDAFVAQLPGWEALTEQQKEQENQWYAAKVVSYDQGLQYCRLTGNRSLFEALLMSR